MGKPTIFTRTVWILSFASLFNDICSEMLYPVLPVYLDSIGFTALWIGVLEGLAEAVVGLSKGYFGQLSDHRGERLPFVKAGYFLSSFSKSAIVFFSHPLWVLTARSGDKLGKGIRTGARDAMLSDEASHEHKGKIFGLHRAMDTTGAAIGPAFALVFLYFYPGEYKTIFYIAFIPAMIGVGITFLIKEKKVSSPKVISAKPGFFSYFKYWKRADRDYKNLVIGLLIFALFNSSDIFLLLMAKEAGFSDLHVVGVYVFYNLVYAVFAYPLGALADKQGMRNVLLFGFILFIIAYASIAFVHDEILLYAVFLLYGIYSAATDGISKAWIAKISPKEETATAIGFYASCLSLVTMLASMVAGALWVGFEPSSTFLFTAAGAFVSVLWIFTRVKSMY
jgi:MFS family permease